MEDLHWLHDRIGTELIDAIVIYAGEQADRRRTTLPSSPWRYLVRDPRIVERRLVAFPVAQCVG